jgi:hypothetical protein
MWQQNRALVLAVVVWLAGSVLFYLVVHLPLSGPAAELERSKLAERLAAHYTRPGKTPAGEPLEDVSQRAQAEREAADRALAEAARLVVFRPRPEYRLPPETAERRVEYVRLRDDATARLVELANKAGVAVPPMLDPRPKSTGLPGKSEIDELLVRLAMTDRVVRSAVAARVPRVAKIEHELGAPRGQPLSRRLVHVRVEGVLDTVVRFIEACSTPSPAAEPSTVAPGGGILTVESADLTAAPKGRVAAELTLAAIELTKIKEPKPPKPEEVEKKTPTVPGRRAGRSF